MNNQPLVNRISERENFQSTINWIDNNLLILKETLANIRNLLLQPVNDKNFNQAISEFHFIIDKIPLMATIIDPTIIVRARPNYDDEIFQYEYEISYNSKNTKGVQAGRFNRPEEGLFYGGLGIDNPDSDHVLAASLECCKELIDPQNPPRHQDLTIGRWQVMDRMPVLNFCFNQDHLSGNKVLQKSTNDYLKHIRESFKEVSANFIEDFVNFISDLSCTINPGNGYYILNAFYYAINYYYKNMSGAVPAGIIYPSAMSERKGLNIVMQPFAVDQFLKLDFVVMYRFSLVKSSKSYVSHPCSDGVEVKDRAFKITNYVPNATRNRKTYF